MNFLELCQRTASECSASLTGPTDTTSQIGRLGQIVKWVNSAWMDIQTRHDDWNFMRSSFTLATTSGDGRYTYSDCTDTGTAVAIANFRSWLMDKFKIYQTSAGQGTETYLRPMSYTDWYWRYNTGAQTNGPPRFVIIAPDSAILLAQVPDGAYTVKGEYMKAATELSGDTDIPEMPGEYHMAIVYRAMMKYGRYNAAAEVHADGQENYVRMMKEMSRTYRPAQLIGGPLA